MKRNTRIVKATTHRTYEDVGEEFGISRQRVHQIVDRARRRAAEKALEEVTPPKACECGSGEPRPYHEDPTEPLAVRWVCDECDPGRPSFREPQPWPVIEKGRVVLRPRSLAFSS